MMKIVRLPVLIITLFICYIMEYQITTLIDKECILLNAAYDHLRKFYSVNFQLNVITNLSIYLLTNIPLSFFVLEWYHLEPSKNKANNTLINSKS